MHLSRRILAGVVDLSWLIAAVAFGIRIRGTSPVPSLVGLLLFVAAFILLILGCRKAFQGTLGEHLWRSSRTASAFFVTAVTLVGAFWITRDTVWKHPVFARASIVELPLVRLDSLPNTDFDVLSFYYTIGAWPKRYEDKPVHYALPYEKGPPNQFVGRIHALWKDPIVRLTFEGPKTPTLEGVTLDPALLQLCLTSRWDRPPQTGELKIPGASIASCIRVREAALNRHFEMIRRIHPIDWSVNWFDSTNPQIQPSERPRGFVIVGRSALEAEEHWVLVNPKGTQQTIILSRPRDGEGGEGEKASRYVQTSIATLRVFENLDAPRAWAGRALALTHLKHAPKTPQEFQKMAEIEARLLSQISVQPKYVDAYFHFGGLMLTQLKALKTGSNTAQKASSQSFDTSLPTRDNLYNTVRYAQDLAPSHAKTLELQDFLISIRRE